jgi:hypothetical protein
MAKRLSPAATVALTNALSVVYWYKDDLRRFLKQCLPNADVLDELEWDNNSKKQIASALVSTLLNNQDKYVGHLTRLCRALCEITSFHHLEELDGGAEKVAQARSAVAQLKQLVEPHEQLLREGVEIAERHKRSTDQLRANVAFREKLDSVKARYTALVVSQNLQTRGLELEKVMYDLFQLFDLDPRASFKIVGEQIDGAFLFDGTDYLFEAKWQSQATNAAALDVFAAKVRRKLENTLGLFLSINGFSNDGVAAHSSGGTVIILMDGADLMAVLEERIRFNDLLLRKKRHAAQTGNIYLRFEDMDT